MKAFICHKNRQQTRVVFTSTG